MPWRHDIPDLDPARDAISATIGEHSTPLGPHYDDDDAPPEDNYVCGEWVLVMQWTGMESGDSWVTCTAPSSVLRTHRNGLLHDALYQMGGQ